MDLKFNSLYKISIFFMRFNRSHPHIPKDKTWACQFVAMHSVFTICLLLILYSTIFHDVKNKDFTQACANSVLAVLYNIVSFCYGMMLWHQGSLAHMIEEMQKDYLHAESLSLEDQHMLRGYAKRGKWVTKLWLVVAVGCAGLFPMQSICLMTYSAALGEFRLVPVYEVTYPPLLEETRDSIVSFTFIYFVMVWYCVYTAAMYGGLVPLGPVFMLHACGQLELVRRRIQELFSDKNYNCEETRLKIKHIVNRMQYIYSFIEHVNNSFTLIYEICLKGTAFALPLLLYKIIETLNEGKISLEFISITIGAVVFSSCPCYYSDLLIETGDSVRQALYMSGWEKHWDRRARNALVVIMIRTMRPIVIQSMFTNVCLAALTDVFHQAYAIFNLLNAVWK